MSIDANEKILTPFTIRMRQMILQYKETKQENNSLYATVDECDTKIKQLKAKLNQVQNDYNSLKLAKMIEISTTDLEATEKRSSRLVRNVNKCITLLNEK